MAVLCPHWTKLRAIGEDGDGVGFDCGECGASVTFPARCPDCLHPLLPGVPEKPLGRLVQLLLGLRLWLRDLWRQSEPPPWEPPPQEPLPPAPKAEYVYFGKSYPYDPRQRQGRR